MKNYEEMSDFEINCRVHAEIMQISGLNSFKAKDYCNNPSYAWPIIIDNHISIECVTVNRHAFTYRVYHSASFTKSTHENPLRAAMIVFLKMNEDKL
ncbi:TPA: phage protein NinX family protein [Escherichia coli]